ncbi:MAG TPA: hypothetical protein VFY09_01785 [Flavobacteriaceae bacterium]|nr:hypothetical protein [Flavobacteriaceae bacterium]HEX5742613.1 hypothetical protein [Flavobacteriaceae bacterium]
MIFTGLKKKRIQNVFEKAIKNANPNAVQINNEPIEKIGVLIDEETYLKNDVEYLLQSILGIDTTAIQIYIMRKFKKKDKPSDIHFTVKDFGWVGEINNPNLQKFIETPFDLFVNFDAYNNMYIKYLTLISKGKFKVGYSKTDDRLYNFMIVHKEDDLKTFINELKKYLKILNKL